VQSKKNWLLVMLIWIITLVILAPANCDHDTNPPPTMVDEKAKPHTDSREESAVGKSPKRHKPKDIILSPSACTHDDDCPSDSSCLMGTCIITNPTDNAEEEVEAEDDEEAEFDAGSDDEQKTVRSCATTENCGCGYECIDEQCSQKLGSFCCANADCKEGDFCKFSEGYTDPNGTCALSECDDSDDCGGGRCGMNCWHHICYQLYCCVDEDCPAEKLCRIFEGQTEGYCVVPECISDTDCGCGHICDATRYVCLDHSPNRPMRCCSNDFYYNGQCLPHEYIEDGHCLDDSQCSAGKVCYESEVCLPATCAKNADCGCEATCWKGQCEYGCDKNSDCCNKGDVCHQGRCENPNEEDEDD